MKRDNQHQQLSVLSEFSFLSFLFSSAVGEAEALIGLGLLLLEGIRAFQMSFSPLLIRRAQELKGALAWRLGGWWFWCFLAVFAVFWSFFGVFWCFLVFFGGFWCFLVFFGVFW